ncbi:hypothetical protein Cgig2_014045 [Carnegiea gigantea]|uniref:Uncharacterized protein n=1 Tax=Carnegiea gigantea TaxID=171969 RepID=A0A9Q1QQ98_9CARY|nr:hypothetical protein Cgig2_014045 [Carnegiea gigantea]
MVDSSSGLTLMDLISADPPQKPAASSSSTPSAPPPASAYSTQMASLATMPTPTTLGKPVTDKKSKKVTLAQIQSDTISVAKAVRANIMSQKKEKKKNSQRKLVNYVFPKLAVYNSVDPSLAPSLLMVSFLIPMKGHNYAESYLDCRMLLLSHISCQESPKIKVFLKKNYYRYQSNDL